MYFSGVIILNYFEHHALVPTKFLVYANERYASLDDYQDHTVNLQLFLLPCLDPFHSFEGKQSEGEVRSTQMLT